MTHGQTPVEYYHETVWRILGNSKLLMMESFQIALERAKQMELERRKEDVRIGYNQGYMDAQCNHVNDADNFAREQEYTNE